MSTKLKTQQELELTFKAGDIVRALRSCEGCYTKGHTYVVREITPWGSLGTVCDDAGSDSNGWGPHNFVLVEHHATPTSNPFAWSGGIPQDPDLHRGYTEECSEYRACQNENGDWVIEARRVKIIAQAADEAEARRIADALNTTINN